MRDYLDRFFRQAIHYKPEIIFGFRLFYSFIFIILFYTAYLTYQSLDRSLVYTIGKISGVVSLVLFCLVILPGILRRFGIRNKCTAFLMVIRRQIGVLMFLFAFLHYASLRLWPIVFGGTSIVLPPPTFEFIGIVALYCLAPLFLTSNDKSVKFLGSWWRRIHSTVYLIVWLLFAHVALQEISPLTILIGVFAFLEIGSLFYSAGKFSSKTNR